MNQNRFIIGKLYKAKQDNEFTLLPAARCTKSARGWIHVMNKYGVRSTANMKRDDVVLIIDQYFTRTSAVGLLGEQTVIVFWHSMEELFPI